MRPIRRVVPAFLLLAIMLVGCGASQREKALHATFVTINGVRNGFTLFDAQRQQQIVTDAKTLEEGKAALAAYRQDRERVLTLFDGVYQALSAAVVADDAKSLAAMTEIVGQLQKALDDLKKAKVIP